MFIRHFDFNREVIVRLDYNARYVDLSQGPIAGLLGGLTSLVGSEIRLRQREFKGVAGFEKLGVLIVESWAADVRQNQIPLLLGGVGPMSSVMQLFQGAKVSIRRARVAPTVKRLLREQGITVSGPTIQF